MRVQNVGCAHIPIAAMFDGFRLTDPNQPVGLALKEKRINLAPLAPALRGVRNQIGISEEAFPTLPYAGTLGLKTPVVVAPGWPAVYLMADTQEMTPVSRIDLVFDIPSTIRALPAVAYGAYIVGPAWNCLHDQRQ